MPTDPNPIDPLDWIEAALSGRPGAVAELEATTSPDQLARTHLSVASFATLHGMRPGERPDPTVALARMRQEFGGPR